MGAPGSLARFDTTPSVQVAGFTPPESPRDEQPDSPRESDKYSVRTSDSTIVLRETQSTTNYEILVTPKTVNGVMNSENSSRSCSRFFPNLPKESRETEEIAD